MPPATRESQEARDAAREAADARLAGKAVRGKTAMGPRSIANMVFIVLLAAAFLGAVLSTVDMIGVALQPPA
jgi:hypothetical protein